VGKNGKNPAVAVLCLRNLEFHEEMTYVRLYGALA
jgi:hypothetical protein